MKNKRLIIFSLLSILTPFLTHASFDPLDINSNGILDSVEQEVVVDTNISLPADEYFLM